ncbi:peroxidasin homolog [Folsomia candida]|nr:peroxidasin homolog [Folsomia candida]
MKWGLLWSPLPKSTTCPPRPVVLVAVLLLKFSSSSTPHYSTVFTKFPNVSLHSSETLPQFDSKVRVEADVFDEDILQYDFPIHYAAYVQNAIETGVKDATELYEKIEPELYNKNIIIENGHPASYLAAINRQAPKSKELARVAYATLRATTVLKEQLAQFRDEIHENDILRRTVFQRSSCPTKRQSDECSVSTHQYRTLDGTCNNLKNPYVGSSFQPFARFLPPEYDDGVSTLRKSISGNELPSARLVSSSIHKDVSRPSSTFTLMLMQWGQLVDHDLTATSQTRAFNHSVPKCCNVSDVHPDCLPIKIMPDDAYFNTTFSTCMEFIRSSPAPRPDCTLGPREQLNQLTSWLDGSVIYGSTAGDLQTLRLFEKGYLKYSNMRNRKALLPQLVHPVENECIISSPRLFCFAAGDGRVNEQPGLTAMHTIWLRQHNLMADKLAEINPHWDEEKLFQETRKIIIAQLQHITYREFLPFVLGPDVLRVFGMRLLKSGYYEGYNNTTDATVPNVFGAAAFRFGHSLVQPQLHRCDENHREMPYKIELSHEMMSPTNIHNLGEVDRISLGLTSQRSQRRDEFITTQLTNHLFQTQGHKGLDLAAINIQRGRDHGLPPYLRWREACGLLKPLNGKQNSTVSNWDDFSEATEIPREKVEWFSKLYESPWDVDLFPGAMVEYPVKGGLLSPTFSCILGQTFLNLRRGDRFWYENPGQFSPVQLQNIRNISLSRVICDTSDGIRTMQPIVFLVPDDIKNPRVDCSNYSVIPIMDFNAWKEEPLSFNLNSISRKDLLDADIYFDNNKPTNY